MKQFKKIFVCLMAMVVLCSSQIAYVSASEIEIMPIASTVTQYATKDGATVIFHFSYSDGNSATFLDIAYDKSKYNILSGPTSSFSGDTCYASVTLFDRTTGATITLGAWCNIYGETGSY